MSELHQSNRCRANAFLAWRSPRQSFSNVAKRRNRATTDRASNSRERSPRVLAWMAVLLIHLALLLSITSALVRKPAASAAFQTTAASLRIRFFETSIRALKGPVNVPATERPSARRHALMARPTGAAVTPDSQRQPPAAALAAPAAAPPAGAMFRSEHGDFAPVDRPTDAASSGDYGQRLPTADAGVMAHGSGGVTYQATRFESAWAPDRENPVSRAIDRTTVHAAIKLGGMTVDCAGGPSAPEALRTSVPVVPLASVRCHGAPTPAPVAAQAVLDIQTLAPATALVDREPPKDAAATSNGGLMHASACIAAAGPPATSGCDPRTRAAERPRDGGTGQRLNTPVAPLH